MSQQPARHVSDDDRQDVHQRNVQRLLGRFLLRIQQYERLMKAMLADHELAGPVDELSARRGERIEKFSDKSLGTLAKSFFETCAVPEGFERNLLTDKDPTDRISLAFSVRITLTRERWIQAKAAIEELVGLRNDMVHHLVERFDLWTDDGCIAATTHLEDAYERIDRQYMDLHMWATKMAEAQKGQAAFFRSDAYRESLMNGIEPDGSFVWEHTGIVRALRQAAQTLAVDGWTPLEEARNWLAFRHPEQTPSKYGCRTWPQVLHESRLFELRYRAEGGRRAAWFRSFPSAA
jgi:hypothetical protein